MVVVYDGGDHSDLVLKAISWFEHSGLFKVNVLSVTDKEILLKQEDYLSIKESREKGHHYDNKDEQESIVKELEKEEFLSNLGMSLIE